MSTSCLVVAVIDDDDLVRDALAAILPAFDCEVETYASADAFLCAVGTTKARCLVIDVNLGLFCGITLGRGLVQAGFGYSVIYMSANTDEATRQRAHDAGCVAFLTKPFTSKDLAHALDVARRREAAGCH